MAKSSLFINKFDEFDLIRRWTRQGFTCGGVGEDAALCKISRGMQAVITTDMVIEGVHFDRRWMQPEEIGWKLLARGLSDLASVGAKPRYFLVSAALPGKTPVQFVDGVYRGMGKLAKKFDVHLIGGDTSHTRDTIVFDLVAVGEVKPKQYVSRRGAKAGDRIYLTGSIGAAGLVLKKFQQGLSRRRLTQVVPRELNRFLTPMPRVLLGTWAARRGARAMIDISDGLLADLGHILRASAVGARLEIEKIPRAQPAGMLAFTSGDDYELLFVAPPHICISHPQVTCIGEITRHANVIQLLDGNGKPIALPAIRGYRHFYA